MDAATETLEQMQARHRKELKDLQGRITSKKKNATKKTRKGVNDECADMERQARERQADEVAALSGGGGAQEEEHQDTEEEKEDTATNDTKLEDATEKLSLDPTPATNGAQQVQEDGAAGGAGKKRNRQKERMARRAAEQEAAAQKAEEEAANMTDHRAIESEYMKKTFKTHNLVEKDIEPDGHCLFSAVADQLGQSGIPIREDETTGGEPAYKTVRRAAAEYMLAHADDFAPFLEDDLESYAGTIRDTAEWGGQLELMALARRYGVEIRVIQDGRTEKIGEEDGQDGEKKTLWLAYYRHGYGLGEHYNSLRKSS